jgi:YjbE family integral membrane protein
MEFWADFLVALSQVVIIDLMLAGDNAIIVGLAAAGIPAAHRRKVIFWGIGAAVLLRILFALVTVQLLAIIGLTLAGGILLLWVCWKFWRELRQQDAERKAGIAPHMPDVDTKKPKTMRAAVLQIVAADVSMSLDNVLAVAGAARQHMVVLVVGLLLSVILMGVAADLISRLLTKHRWLAYVGLLIVLYVALDMIWRGWEEVAPHLGAA